jgi:hypothetical protein
VHRIGLGGSNRAGGRDIDLAHCPAKVSTFPQHSLQQLEQTEAPQSAHSAIAPLQQRRFLSAESAAMGTPKIPLGGSSIAAFNHLAFNELLSL